MFIFCACNCIYAYYCALCLELLWIAWWMVVFFENVSWIALGIENDGVLYENPHVHID